MDPVMALYAMALRTALVLALPLIVAIGCVGVAASLIQSLVGIQDQNISFAPKIAVAALCVAIGGLPAMALLEHLLLTAIQSLPRLTG